MSTAYQQAVGIRLRAVREARGWSLRAAEDASRGRWPAVVIGSYERGDRALTVQKLSELGRFYGVPLSSLLPGELAAGDRPAVLDEFPGEMDLCRDSCGRWVLVLSAPEVHGTAVSTSRAMVLALAEAFASMKRAESRSAA
jgi:hypothetical protein